MLGNKYLLNILWLVEKIIKRIKIHAYEKKYFFGTSKNE